MNKTESIARRILGWKLNRWDRWYDSEKDIFIHDYEFQPEKKSWSCYAGRRKVREVWV